MVDDKQRIQDVEKGEGVKERKKTNSTKKNIKVKIEVRTYI